MIIVTRQDGKFEIKRSLAKSKSGRVYPIPIPNEIRVRPATDVIKIKTTAVFKIIREISVTQTKTGAVRRAKANAMVCPLELEYLAGRQGIRKAAKSDGSIAGAAVGIHREGISRRLSNAALGLGIADIKA